MYRDPIRFRRELRRDGTEAEQRLWRLLRSRRFLGFKFRRQHPIGGYVVDFFCADRGLVVELDGGQHFLDSGRQHDEQRDRYLDLLGLRTVRFTNLEVFENLAGVLERIRMVLESPSP